MRRSEITPELIELSKKAKELGFPQDVEEGDWIAIFSGLDYDDIPRKQEDFPIVDCVTQTKPSRYYSYCTIEENGSVFSEDPSIYCYFKDDFCLILSFSRCLEWIEQEKYGVHCGLNNSIHGRYIFSVGTKGYRAKTHHEAIAKAVVRILESDNE